MVYVATAIKSISTSGFSTSGDIKCTNHAPNIEPKNTSGKYLPTILKSMFPERKNEIVLVRDPIDPASLFVAIAVDGDKPVNIKAGIEIKPPPPTTESINAAKKPNATNNKSVYKSKSIMQTISLTFNYKINNVTTLIVTTLYCIVNREKIIILKYLNNSSISFIY